MNDIKRRKRHKKKEPIVRCLPFFKKAMSEAYQIEDKKSVEYKTFNTESEYAIYEELADLHNKEMDKADALIYKYYHLYMNLRDDLINLARGTRGYDGFEYK